jgi:hypothetical protein
VSIVRTAVRRVAGGARIGTGVRAGALAAGLAGGLLAAPAQAQDANNFSWDGKVAAGSWVKVRDVNGSVRVEAGSGDRVVVTAVKRARRGDPKDVRIEVRRYGNDNVLVCALWNENATCDEEGYHSNRNGSWSSRGNDVSVDFLVKLPRGVNVGAYTTNGEVRVGGATAEVDARTTNGDVEAESSGGPVSARTTNGDVRASMGNTGTGDLRYTTTNGSVTVELPASFDADLELGTTNGSLRTDYPIAVQGRVSQRRLQGTVGKGGRSLVARTTNGNVTLRKRV